MPFETELISEQKNVNCNEILPGFGKEDKKMSDENSGDLGDKSKKIKLDLLLAGMNKQSVI